MVTLARQESNWTDCSDAVIACSSRQCSTVCQNGPNAGKACTTGTSHVCQGGTERDGTFCTKANPSECGQMREGMCEGMREGKPEDMREDTRKDVRSSRSVTKS